MKAGIIFSGSGPLLILTSYDSFTDAKFVDKLKTKGVLKFIAFEVPVETAQKRYGLHYDIILADLKQKGVGPQDYTKVNVNGSGISLGHPIAATGVRVLVTLVHEMKRRGVQYGLECICGGGGLGIAAVFERK